MATTTDGYIYAFVNESMPGLVKMGFTRKSPLIRLRQANKRDTFRPPTPYTLLVAKHVKTARIAESALHITFKEQRIAKSEFFRVTQEAVVEVFVGIEGEPYLKPAATV